MIIRTIFRMAWVVTALLVAVAVALTVLFALGAVWVGDKLKEAAPNDPLLRDGAPIFGMVMFASTVGPALTALPAVIAVVAGEVMRIRSWMYYVLTGGAALAGAHGSRLGRDRGQPLYDHLRHMTIFAAAGFAGGFIYWLLAGARA